MRVSPARGTALLLIAAVGVLAGCTAADPPLGRPSGTAAPGAGAAPDDGVPEVRFTAAGDYSSSAEAAAVLAGIGEAQPDLHLAVGDLSYGAAGEEGAWCEFVTSRVGDDLPFELLAGNHEGDGRNGHIDGFAECLPNRLPGLVGEYGRQYFVDVPQNDPVVRFVLISPAVPFDDGVWDYGEGTERFEWTADAIAGAKDAGIPWVVVGMHKPCHSVGGYPCEPGPAISNLIIESGADLVLSGHEHIYQRTHQLGHAEGCPEVPADAFEPACVIADDGDLIAGAGTVFVTVGTGGAQLRDVHPGDPDAAYFAAASGANRSPTWGFLEVNADHTTLTASFRPVEGAFEDSFTITAADGR